MPESSASKRPWRERDEGWLTKAEVDALVDKALAPLREALSRV